MKQIIIADDEEANRHIYSYILEKEFQGYEPELFSNGNSLVGRLEKDVSNVALILTDNRMFPGPTGSEIIKKYANDARFRGLIPFILIFGGDEDIGKKAVEDGAFYYLLKPYGISQLTSILQRALDEYRK
jgi:DNA-binding NtrC family response regulator